MQRNETAIIEALHADLGRPPFETWMADVVTTVGESRHAMRNVAKWMRPTGRTVHPYHRWTRTWIQHDPRGTVLIIGPWNVPFFLTLGPLAGAVAAGNTVIVKPSELAPESSRLIAALVPQYLDGEAIRVVEGGADVTQRLIAEGLDRVLFTGGTGTGRKIMAGAAQHLTPVTLELGGKSPVVVAADADLAVAAKRITWIKLLNAGQVCVAPDYVLVHERVATAFSAHLRDAFSAFGAQHPHGVRIVNRPQFDRLTDYLNATEGTVVVGGESDRESLTFVPTVVEHPDPAEPLMTHEIFGPILPVVHVQDLDAAIDLIKARPKPLAAYLFTKSAAVREHFVREVSAGGIVVNHLLMQVATAKLPFGGVGGSGTGAYHGRWGFEEFSHRKLVQLQPTRTRRTAAAVLGRSSRRAGEAGALDRSEDA